MGNPAEKNVPFPERIFRVSCSQSLGKRKPDKKQPPPLESGCNSPSPPAFSEKVRDREAGPWQLP